MRHRKNAVLIASSSWGKEEFRANYERIGKLTDTKRPYAIVFGEEKPIKKEDVNIFLRNNFKVIWK